MTYCGRHGDAREGWLRAAQMTGRPRASSKLHLTSRIIHLVIEPRASTQQLEVQTGSASVRWRMVVGTTTINCCPIRFMLAAATARRPQCQLILDTTGLGNPKQPGSGGMWSIRGIRDFPLRDA